MIKLDRYKLMFAAIGTDGKPLFCSFTPSHVEEAIAANPGTKIATPPEAVDYEARALELMKGLSQADRAILQLWFSKNGGVNPIPGTKADEDEGKPTVKAKQPPATPKKSD